MPSCRVKLGGHDYMISVDFLQPHQKVKPRRLKASLSCHQDIGGSSLLVSIMSTAVVTRESVPCEYANK